MSKSKIDYTELQSDNDILLHLNTLFIKLNNLVKKIETLETHEQLQNTTFSQSGNVTILKDNINKLKIKIEKYIPLSKNDEDVNEHEDLDPQITINKKKLERIDNSYSDLRRQYRKLTNELKKLEPKDTHEVESKHSKKHRIKIKRYKRVRKDIKQVEQPQALPSVLPSLNNTPLIINTPSDSPPLLFVNRNAGLDNNISRRRRTPLTSSSTKELIVEDVSNSDPEIESELITPKNISHKPPQL